METFTTNTRKSASDMLASFINEGFVYSYSVAPQRGETEWHIYKTNDIEDFRAFHAASMERARVGMQRYVNA